MGPQELVLAAVNRQKLAWCGYVIRHDNLSKTTLQGTWEGGLCRGQQRKYWMDKSDNIIEWTSLPMLELLNIVSCRKDWKRISVELSFMTPLTSQSVKGLN